MVDQIIVTFCICDEILKCFNFIDDPQCKMATSEVMTFAITSALIYGCNYGKARLCCMHLRLFNKILSHSQLVRRIHAIPQYIWTMVFSALKIFLINGKNLHFIIDSFPVKAYENHKSFRARIFAEKQYHGYTASKKQYFFGIKVHMLVNTDGIPIEFSFTPGSQSDITALKNMNLDLPIGSVILGDKAYGSYEFEDALLETQDVRLIAKRRKNLKRQHSPCDVKLLSKERNKIETVFCSITSRMPRHIRAKTEEGFCLKVMFFILAYMVNLFYPV